MKRGNTYQYKFYYNFIINKYNFACLKSEKKK